MKKLNKKQSIMAFIAFSLIMIGLGASDAMRGIFGGIFESHFQLGKVQVSWIVTISYIGNLFFMLFGSHLADRYERKKVCLGIMIMWMASLLLYILTDQYYCLLIGMFISMGASTLMNTMMNVMSPYFFGTAAGMMVNVLFFVQGIGTSGNQKISGTLASGYGDFRLVNVILLGFGIIGTLLLCFVNFGDKDTEGASAQAVPDELKEVENGTLWKEPLIWIFGLIFGLYFIAEHGILNWWSMYLNQGLETGAKIAANSLSIFFAGMTIGRLVFSPVVLKLGSRKSILCLGGIGAVLYIAGIFLGGSGIWIVSAAGLFMSIVYPTLVLQLQDYFSKERIVSATGIVLSIGTLFDIGFNAVFGNVIDGIGFRRGILIFPICMIGFYVLFLLVHKKQGKAQ